MQLVGSRPSGTATAPAVSGCSPSGDHVAAFRSLLYPPAPSPAQRTHSIRALYLKSVHMCPLVQTNLIDIHGLAGTPISFFRDVHAHARRYEELRCSNGAPEGDGCAACKACPACQVLSSGFSINVHRCSACLQSGNSSQRSLLTHISARPAGFFPGACGGRQGGVAGGEDAAGQPLSDVCAEQGSGTSTRPTIHDCRCGSLLCLLASDPRDFQYCTAGEVRTATCPMLKLDMPNLSLR